MKRFLDNLFGARRDTRPASRAQARRPQYHRMAVEQLPDRILPAVTVDFSGIALTITGDYRPDDIVLTNNTASQIMLNGDVITTPNGTPTVYSAIQIIVEGGGGNDTIDLSGLGTTVNSVGKWLYGGAGDDIIYGHGAGDLLKGGDGNDTLYGGGGNDGLYGEAGDDHLYGQAGDDGLYGDDYVGGTPSGGNDFLDGGAGNDTLRAGGGDDTLHISPDSDTFDGGFGSDTLSPAGITGNTFHVTGTNAGTVNGRTFSGVENLTGGMLRDMFAFTVVGFLDGSINGSSGNDFLDYSVLSIGVTVNLETGSATRVGNGAAGRVSGVENVLGSQGNDTLTGNDLSNVLVGNGGSDTLSGLAGRDILIGGSDPAGGVEYLNGGLGEDILIADVTAYDNNVSALANLQNLWNGPGTHMTRRYNIQTSFTPLTEGVTVFTNFCGDALDGGSDRWTPDFIFNGSPDCITGGT